MSREMEVLLVMSKFLVAVLAIAVMAGTIYVTVEAQEGGSDLRASIVNLQYSDLPEPIDVVRLDWTLPDDVIGTLEWYRIYHLSGCSTNLDYQVSGREYEWFFHDRTVERGTSYRYYVQGLNLDDSGQEVVLWRSDPVEITFPLLGDTASPQIVSYESAGIADHPEWMRVSWRRGNDPQFYGHQINKLPVDVPFRYFYAQYAHGCQMSRIDTTTEAGHPYRIQVSNTDSDWKPIGEPSAWVQGVAEGAPDIRRATDLEIDAQEIIGVSFQRIKIRWKPPVHEDYEAIAIDCKERFTEEVIYEEPDEGHEWDRLFRLDDSVQDWSCWIETWSGEHRKGFVSADPISFTIPALTE